MTHFYEGITLPRDRMGVFSAHLELMLDELQAGPIGMDLREGTGVSLRVEPVDMPIPGRKLAGGRLIKNNREVGAIATNVGIINGKIVGGIVCAVAHVPGLAYYGQTAFEQENFIHSNGGYSEVANLALDALLVRHTRRTEVALLQDMFERM